MLTDDEQDALQAAVRSLDDALAVLANLDVALSARVRSMDLDVVKFPNEEEYTTFCGRYYTQSSALAAWLSLVRSVTGQVELAESQLTGRRTETNLTRGLTPDTPESRPVLISGKTDTPDS